MSKITRKQVVNAVFQLLRQAETELPEDVLSALKAALETESDSIARTQLTQIIENVELAKKHGIPMCQDTGTPVFFVELGYDAEIDFDLMKAIQEGVSKATKEIPLRHNAVHPLTRERSENELMDVNLSLAKGDKIKITVATKGSGSENMSALRMFNPSEIKNIKRFVLETVKNAGGRSCPPILVGVGIGGTFDGAAKLAKKAVLRSFDQPMDTFERELLDSINSLCLGPMGLGGNTTAMAVNVEYGDCHTASLPVAVNIQCWAARRASITLRG
ncbi:fumarate hydratase [Halobacteriota archaeon]